MTEVSNPAQSRRNRNFAETHERLILKAIELIARDGVEGLTIAALARLAGMNRSTVYYHFVSRESLLEAVKAWSAAQMAGDGELRQPLEAVIGFVLAHPEVIKLWVEDFISPGQIATRYPGWDQLVADVAARHKVGSRLDAEVFCTLLLAGVVIGPRVFVQSVRPDESHRQVVARFAAEVRRLLVPLGLDSDWM